jgi:DNA polymerase-3 subunit epsilon
MAGYAVVGVETTGFLPERGDRVIEVAVTHLDSCGEVECAWGTVLDPQCAIDDSGVHTLTSEDVVGAPTFAEAAGQIAAWLDGRVFVAHNAAYTRRFVVSEFERAGWQVPLSSKNSVCTMMTSLATWSGAPRRLGRLCASRGVQLARGRTALSQAVATAKIMGQLLDAAIANPRTRIAGRLPWAAQLEAAALIRWPATPGVGEHEASLSELVQVLAV